MVSQEYTYTYGTVTIPDSQWNSLILPQVNAECMQIFLDEVSGRYPEERIVMVLDGAGWYKSKQLKLLENMKLLPLPPYSPELNPARTFGKNCVRNTFTIG